MLLPTFFGLRIQEAETVGMALLGALAFSLIASGVYILNDWRDLEADRAHPSKRLRPLASGQVPVQAAVFLMFLLMVIGLGIFWLLDPLSLYLALAYVGINVLYSIRLKQIALLDIFIIAMGFVIRVGIGATVVNPNIPLSMWIMVMTFLGALFLGLAKRRDDVLLAATGLQVRKSIDGYNLEFINGAMVMMASVLIVGYLSYVSDPEVMAHFHTRQLYITAAFVVLGVLRYMQIAFVEEKSGSPTGILLGDRFLQITIAGWLATFVWLIYWN
ncbi:MAG: UbiA prenyltransferase family protein [Bacteroidia bacterium]|nr:UbiA prenyltransferase family protein [Bacteroidia bacterium]